MVPATDDAFSNAVLVTLVGSNKPVWYASTTSFVLALYVVLSKFELCTSCNVSCQCSFPALDNIFLNGAKHALCTILTPNFLSGDQSKVFDTALRNAVISEIPPPGIIPSDIAALVANNLTS